MNSERGAGLVEIVIALAIFSIGLTFAIKSLPKSNEATTRGRNITKATNFAQQKLEELMGISYAAPDLTAGAHTDPANPIARIYTRSWFVTNGVPANGMKRVVVTVTFETGSPDSVVSLSTFVTSRR